MENHDNNERKENKSKKLIIVLVILLLLSLAALAGRYIYLNYIRDNGNSSVTVPENVIGDAAKDKDEGGESQGGQASQGNQGAQGGQGTQGMNNGGNSSENGAADNNGDNDNQNAGGNTEGNNPPKKDPIKAPSVELDKNHPEDNERFDVSGMLPGDKETKYYCIKTHHEYDVKVYFEATINEQTKNLGEVLNISVTDVTDGIDEEANLVDGTFDAVDGKSFFTQLKKNKDNYTKKYYRVDVSLDTSVGNPYQDAALSADFKWYVTDEEYKDMVSKKPIIPGITDKEESEVPKTGDLFDKTLWVTFVGSTLALLILIAKRKKSKEVE